MRWTLPSTPRNKDESIKRNFWYMWVTRYTYADFSKALISEVRSQYRSVSPVNYLLKNLNLLNIYRKILFKKMVNSPSTHHFVIEPLVSVIWHSLIPKDKIDRDASNTSSAQSKTVRWYPIQDLNISTPLSLIQGNMSSRKEKLNAMLGFLPLRKIYSSMCCIMTLILTLSRFLKWYLLQLSWIDPIKPNQLSKNQSSPGDFRKLVLNTGFSILFLGTRNLISFVLKLL